ncbi:hypothetical protein AVEN_240614-1 [Araneus ventricosus]|uniref:Uncharacterized protein n=1 Tax=Araneus ventricosus TaxID=182803 RepID=A0A4Y2D667_ARAVE|nr:hypothetical protein AVEN_240614-1 [Araneus ventricosus]
MKYWQNGTLDKDEIFLLSVIANEDAIQSEDDVESVSKGKSYRYAWMDMFRKYLCPALTQHESCFVTDPHDFEPMPDDEDEVCGGTPMSELPHHTSGRTFGLRFRFTCTEPHTRRIFGGIEIRSSNPQALKPKYYH